MADRNSKRTRIDPVFTRLGLSPDRGWAQRLVELSDGIQVRIETGAVRSVQCTSERRFDASSCRLAWMLRNWRRLAPSNGSRYREFVARMSNPVRVEAALRELEAGHRSLPRELSKMVLEGPTSADCLVECEHAVVWVEGKRDDWLAPGTSWDLARDQLARNIEAAWLLARKTGREYCLIIAYEEKLKHHEQALIEGYRSGAWSAGWPHLEESQRRELGQRIGTIRWLEIAEEWPELASFAS